MDTTRINALLLFGIVAAGAMTMGNAYAQTNTDRLVQILEDTSGIVSVLEDIDASITSALNQILASTSSIYDTVSHMDEVVHNIEDNIGDVNNAVTGIDSTITDFISADLERAAIYMGALERYDVTLSQIQSSLEGVASDADGLNAMYDAVARNSANIASLKESVDMMNSKLDSISETLGVVQSTVEMPASAAISEIAALSPGNLVGDTTTHEFTVANFGNSVTEVPKERSDELYRLTGADEIGVDTVKYTAIASFTCTNDVYVEMIAASSESKLDYTINDEDGSETGDAFSSISAGFDYGEIESIQSISPMHDIYLRNFGHQHASNIDLSDGTELDRDAVLNYYALEADVPLNIKAVYREVTNHFGTVSTPVEPSYDDIDNDNEGIADDLIRPVSYYVGIDDITNATRMNVGGDSLAEVTVKWTTSYPNTECTFEITSDADRGMESKNLYVTFTGNKNGGVTYDFDNTITCNDHKTTITGVAISAPGLELHDYADYAMSSVARADKDDEDKYKEITSWTFNSTGSFVDMPGAFPYEIMSGDVLKFTGALALDDDSSQIIVRIIYDTIKGNECEVDSTG